MRLIADLVDCHIIYHMYLLFDVKCQETDTLCVTCEDIEPNIFWIGILKNLYRAWNLEQTNDCL